MTKKQAPPREAHAEMKPDDALSLVRELMRDLDFDSYKLLRLLLLLHWMAYAAEWDERDTLCVEAKIMLAGYIDGAGDVIKGQMRRQFDAIRKKGGPS